MKCNTISTTSLSLPLAQHHRHHNNNDDTTTSTITTSTTTQQHNNNNHDHNTSSSSTCTAVWKAVLEGATTTTPWDPPSVKARICATGSSDLVGERGGGGGECECMTWFRSRWRVEREC